VDARISLKKKGFWNDVPQVDRVLARKGALRDLVRFRSSRKGEHSNKNSLSKKKSKESHPQRKAALRKGFPKGSPT